MKRFLLALAAVAALTLGSSFTSTAMADGGGHRGHGHHGHHGHAHHGHYHHGHHYRGGYGGGYGGGYYNYRPSYGYGGYGQGRSYGYADPCYDDYGYRSGGAIQIYGPRGGFSLGF